MEEIYQCRWRRFISVDGGLDLQVRRFISVDGGLDLQTLPRMRMYVNGQEKHLQVRRFISVDGGGGVDLQTLPRMRMYVNGQEKHAQVKRYTGKTILFCKTSFNREGFLLV